MTIQFRPRTLKRPVPAAITTCFTIRVDLSSGRHIGAVPGRPFAGHRLLGIAVAPPADIGAGRHVDEFGRIGRQGEFERRDVARSAPAAIPVRRDHGLDVDRPEMRVAQQQGPGLRRLRCAGRGTEKHDQQKCRSHGFALSVGGALSRPAGEGELGLGGPMGEKRFRRRRDNPWSSAGNRRHG